MGLARNDGWHLAEAAYCMMKKREPYKDKGVALASSREA
jgi:hypothetical protein